MKKYSIVILFSIMVGCHAKDERSKLATIRELPAFQIISLDSSVLINTSELPSGHSIVFMYFSPTCDHCKFETTEILKHSKDFRNTHIFMVTNDPSEETKSFCSQFHLDTMKNIFVGKDYNYTFYRAYLPSNVPFLAIYDKDKKLKKIYTGDTRIGSILNTILE